MSPNTTMCQGAARYDDLRRPGGGQFGAAPVTTDLDIYRTASVLIREHGDEADLVAAERADSFLDAGDMAGSAVWQRVLKAIKEIRCQEPREGEAVY